MRLKRLKLTGFKSFVEPTELRIEGGLTGIVGPNGCGKSNLLEAIRWVMGENSPKSMRGGGMDDVIFAGTGSRPQRDFAEVSLLAERDAAQDGPGIIANDDSHEIEVTRRIERGAGSAYRANGRDVRAKDIALIFADAATGAHSPALVSQGRIGAIIAAKPQERRMMLEEAAGISGLHVRRKDAEQKLRAASTNLDRLDTMLGDMAQRVGQLKRQARQAERYRQLTEEIACAEARLVFVRWREAKGAADQAKAEAQQAGEAVEKAAAAQRELTAQQQTATAKLAQDRAAAMAARDAAGDLAGKIIGLAGERDHLAARLSDLSAQAARLAADGERETKLTHDAAGALERLKEENASLADQVKAAEAQRPELEQNAVASEKALRDSELSLARAHAEQARMDAARQVANAALGQAEKRVQRLGEELVRLAADRAALGNIAELEAEKQKAEQECGRLENEIAQLDGEIGIGEAKRQELLALRSVAQEELAGAQAQLAALIAERDALAKALARHDGDRAIDRIRVTAGYEKALAAALGDDVDAAIGGEAGRRWTSTDAVDVSRKGGRLIEYVDAPTELQKRLQMVILCETDDGRMLAPGERLVTLDGRLRRWDGFFSEDDGATHAEALIRANRLEALGELIEQANSEVTQAQVNAENIAEQIEYGTRERQATEARRQAADGEYRQILREVDRSSDALERAKAAGLALEERLEQNAGDMQAANAELKEAKEAVAELPDAAANDALVARLENEGEALREGLQRTQAELSAFDQSLGQMKERRAVTASEIRSWQDRAGEAEKRIAEMRQRQEAIASEQAEIAGKPESLASQIAALEEDKEALAAKLAKLQADEQESESALRRLEAQLAEAAEALSSSREARAGAEARAENQESRRIEMGRISGERFECPPPLLPEKLGFAEDDVGAAGEESARLEQLQASRERIGPVNLIAADELAELESDQAEKAAESEELTQAIHQLRGSIGALNREGRARLLEAFEAVDQHFRGLFTTLFQGGQAHLALVESDDPLEAGLEIYAQPPGKKLQSLTLLSGGEQALTAIALIFALFLTNPAPICVLDEVDAPLDDANIERFCDLLDRMQRETDTRYLIVTHNAVTMSRMHRLFGVTMIEQGVSRLVSVDLDAAEELLAAE